MYTISDEDHEQTPATSEWKVVAKTYTDNGTISHCTPHVMAAYNSHLEIKAGKIVSLIPKIETTPKISSNIT